MKLHRIIARPSVLIAAGMLFCAGSARSQGTEAPASSASPQAASQGPANSTQPRRLTLQDVLALARKNSVQFQSAQTDAAISRQDRYQAATALLPSVTYNNQALYTKSNGPGNGVRYIANNAVHEYISQANIHETIDLAGISNLRRASAAAALSRARAEIASRGLVVAVVQGYYALAAAQQKLQAAQKASDEGNRFFKLTQDLQGGGEVAHSDVIKAELQMNDRRRQLQEAQLMFLNARLDLAVLLFPDFNENYEVADDLHSPVPLPTLAEVQQQAAHDNPDVRAALEAVRAAGSDVTFARAGYLPSLSFDYWYGIDAAQFAVNGPNGVSNLGSAAAATLNIPIWNWGATQSRIKQAELRRTQAKRELSLAQRKLLAEIRSLYAEADTALNELADLNRSAELAEDGLRLTMLRYTGGEATILEVVDAQNTSVQANTAYQDGAVRYRVALANLQTLTGALTTP
ncbi:MAG: TolC family protein [Acidobacteria bacterium]|nr:MAG: TolC family protein [Acidobacteriota bacterium]